MIVIRAILVVLGALAGYFGLDLVIGGGVGAVIGGVVLLALAAGLLALGLWTLRGSADDVTSRLAARQRVLEERSGRAPRVPGAAQPSVQQSAQQVPTNRAGRRAAERAARRKP